MTRSVLHIGLMKTGTTYLQGILSQNREALALAGWSYPGRRENQQHACYGICGSDIYWVADDNPYRAAGGKLVTELRDRETDVVVSAEALSSMSETGIERFLSTVGTPTSVTLTVRPLDRLLPSAWQQTLKSGATDSQDSFLVQLREARPSLAGMWRTYAFGHIVRRWAAFCPVDVVIVPRSSRRDALWELFREAVGLPDLPEVDVQPTAANISFSEEVADILSSLNGFLAAQGYSKRQQARVRNTLLQEGVFQLDREHAGTRICLPEEWRAEVRGWNDEETALLRSYARAVHGDLADLEAEPPSADEHPRELSHARTAAGLLLRLLQSHAS